MASLRARLTLAVMTSTLALALALGAMACWIIHTTISTASDRLLVSSVVTISHALDAGPGPGPGRALRPRSIKPWPADATPAPVYSVYEGDRLIAGMPGLRPPQAFGPAGFARNGRKGRSAGAPADARDVPVIVQPTYLREAVIGGRPARVATEILRLRGSPHMVAIQAAEFLDDRQAYERSYFPFVLGAVALIGIMAALLSHGAIRWGLRPFASLTAQIDAASTQMPGNVRLTLAAGDPLEAQRLANAFNDLMARTERVSESLRQFTADASHQLRTPLAIVRVHVDVLQRFGSQSPQGAAALADITAAIASLERLLAQLLALARMDEQRAEPVPLAPFDLTGLAATVMATRLSHPDTARMDIGLEGGGARIHALGDAVFAAEMIANLFDNAIRHNRADGSVTVRIAERGGAPILEIEDDGPGIAPDRREKVWERFYRAAGADAPPGSGLGLPIVRALGERIGAQIHLEEGPGGRGLKAVIMFLSAQPASPHDIQADAAARDQWLADRLLVRLRGASSRSHAKTN